MYKYLNLNPSKRHTIDCVVRGISFVTEQSWDTTFLALAVECIKYHDMPELNYVWESYLSRLGFTRHVVPNTCPVCFTVKDFCRDYPIGTYLLVIVNYETGGHVVAVQTGDYYDIWDSGNEVVTYYWRKEVNTAMRKELETLKDMYFDELSAISKHGTLSAQDNEAVTKALCAIQMIYDIHEWDEKEIAEKWERENGYSERRGGDRGARTMTHMIRKLEDMEYDAPDNYSQNVISRAISELRNNRKG